MLMPQWHHDLHNIDKYMSRQPIESIEKVALCIEEMKTNTTNMVVLLSLKYSHQSCLATISLDCYKL